MASDRACRVYVGNLAWSVDEEELENHMKSAGTVLKAQVFKYKDGHSKGSGMVTFSEPSEAQNAIKQMRDTKISDRMIFVREDRENSENEEGRKPRNRNFRRRFNRNPRPNSDQNQNDQEKYNNDTNYNPRQNRPRRFPRNSRGRPIPKEGDTVVNIENLSPDTTWRSLKDFFKKAGNVTRADVLPAIENGKSGVVHFSNYEDAVNAVKTLNDEELEGSKIVVSIQEAKSQEENED